MASKLGMTYIPIIVNVHFSIKVMVLPNYVIG